MKTISATALATYLACGERYNRKYNGLRQAKDQPIDYSAIEGFLGTTNHNMIAGTGFHAAIEQAINKSLAHAADPNNPSPTVDDCVAYGISIACNEYRYKAPADAVLEFSPEASLDAILTRVKRAATWYLETQFDKLRPAQAERRFCLPLPGTKSSISPDGWYLVGKIDCVEEDGLVRDFKLSGSPKPPDVDIAEKSEQLSVYALARFLETGSVPPLVVLDYCRDMVRMGCIERVGKRSEKDCQKTLLRIQRVVECIDAGVYPLASKESFQCSGRWCDYYMDCPFGGGQPHDSM